MEERKELEQAQGCEERQVEGWAEKEKGKEQWEEVEEAQGWEEG